MPRSFKQLAAEPDAPLKPQAANARDVVAWLQQAQVKLQDARLAAVSPGTRMDAAWDAVLLTSLAVACAEGCKDPLAEMQKIIEAEKQRPLRCAGLVAFAAAPQSHQQRAERARQMASGEFTDKQQAFIDFVLSQYVQQGVGELDQEKLSPLLRLKYRALPDAFAELGKADQVRKVFVGFQRHLYAN